MPEDNLAPYMRGALSYHKLLVKHERANDQYEEVKQGQETDAFWSLFFGNSPKTNPLYGNVNEWNPILIDVSNFSISKPLL